LLGLLLLSALTGAASAQERTCHVVREVDFRGLVYQLQAAIDRGDADTSHALSQEIYAQIPCFGFAPDSRLLADYLVARAVDAFAANEPWEPAMTLALQLRPDVDRGVGGGHPLATWEPPARAAALTAPIPEGVELTVDGVLARSLPSPQGLHLVQRRSGEYWASMWTLDEPIDEAWMQAEIEGPRRLLPRGEVGVGAGMHQESQALTFHADAEQRARLGAFRNTFDDVGWCSDAVPGSQLQGGRPCRPAPVGQGWGTVHARGTTNLYSRIALVGEASHVMSFAGGFQGNMWLGLGYLPKRAYAGVGVGLFAVRTYYVIPDVDVGPVADGDQTGVQLQRIDELAYPLLMMGARGPNGHPWSVGASAGIRTQFVAASARVSLPIWEPREGLTLLVGGRVEAAGATYALANNPGYRAYVSQTQAAFELGVVVGER